MKYKQVILVREDLKLPKGKLSVQVAHASLDAALKSDKKILEAWKEQGQAKIVLQVDSKQELLELFEELKNLFPTALIKDAGKTQIQSGEVTAIGIGPVPENEINKYTKDLKLL
ncbi:peptidyl-tRNA hydrolase [archaeon]|nr:peptidyl-tRNA hydrolase [archaeon]